MYAATTLVTLLAAAGSALAAPTADVSARGFGRPAWYVSGYSKTCPSASKCTIKFGIDNGISGGQVYACSITTSGAPTPSKNSFTGIECGKFTVSGSWSGQFGEGNGFTTYAIVDREAAATAYPAYSDTEVANGQAGTLQCDVANGGACHKI